MSLFPLPLVVTLRPSRRLRLAVAALHLAAALALWLADLPVPAQIAGTLLLAASLGVHARPGSEATLRGKADGKLEIRQNNAWVEIEQVSYGLVLPLITLLGIKTAGTTRPRYFVMLADSLPPEDYRRFRVWLEWLGKKPKQPQSSQPSSPLTGC